MRQHLTFETAAAFLLCVALLVAANLGLGIQ